MIENYLINALVSSGIDSLQLDTWQTQAKQKKQKIIDYILRENLINEKKLLEYCCRYYHWQSIDIFSIDPENINKKLSDHLQHQGLFAIVCNDKKTIIINDPCCLHFDNCLHLWLNTDIIFQCYND